jgi:hypothetical protein
MADIGVGWTTSGTAAPGWGVRETIRRRLTRVHALLWGLVFGATAVDTVSTLVGLHVGLTEGNPVVVALLEAFGPAGLLVVKLPALLTVGTAWLALSRRNAAIALGLFGAVTSLVVANNVLAIVVELAA